jgi:hypothetical protein
MEIQFNDWRDWAITEDQSYEEKGIPFVFGNILLKYGKDRAVLDVTDSYHRPLPISLASFIFPMNIRKVFLFIGTNHKPRNLELYLFNPIEKEIYYRSVIARWTEVPASSTDSVMLRPGTLVGEFDVVVVTPNFIQDLKIHNFTADIIYQKGKMGLEIRQHKFNENIKDMIQEVFYKEIGA